VLSQLSGDTAPFFILAEREFAQLFFCRPVVPKGLQVAINLKL
jgi:hypothetical protein